MGDLTGTTDPLLRWLAICGIGGLPDELLWLLGGLGSVAPGVVLEDTWSEDDSLCSFSPDGNLCTCGIADGYTDANASFLPLYVWYLLYCLHCS